MAGEERPTLRRHAHPGARRRGGRSHPKGRQVEPAALDEVRALLGDRPRRRDLLIEHLHLIQDAFGQIPAAHLAALAAEMGIPLAEAWEVASFYAHFDLRKEDEAPVPAVTVRVCDSLPCVMAGGDALAEALARDAGAGMRVVRAPCMGRCDTAPAAEAGRRHLAPATAEAVLAAVAAGETEPEIPAYRDFEAYRGDGGYKLLEDCLAGRQSAETIVGALRDSGLRGLGGAGFPTGSKWDIVRGMTGRKMMAVNADEGEPGTFKDRHYLETDPHRMLEGMLVGSWVVGAGDAVIYLRDEYPHIREILLAEIPLIEAAGLARATRIDLRRGAGAYICGEESAMIESIEGKRGLPRHRPPYVAEVGLFGSPTLVNNVETLFWIPEIVARGAEWFASRGRGESKGLRSYSVSGRVAEPGVKLAPAGISVRELIEEHCGGMQEGHRLRGFLPGGASGGILPAEKADLPLDFGTLEPHGCFVGSHAVIVLSEEDGIRDAALNLMRFFEDESCGQCTPCRVGTEKLVGLMQAPRWDEALIEEVGRCMADASICGLGQAAANPVFSALRHFPEDAT